MAALAIGLAGAAVGGATLGTGVVAFGLTGTAIGWTAGSIVGNMLFQQSAPDVHTQGPRLGDQTVSSSAYGQMIPIAYGTVAVAGNLIDASDYYETAHTTTQSSGKGGGGQEVSSTTYTYSIDLAVALCEGPIDGVQQIYANEKLIYDKRSTSDAIKKSWVSLKIYTGTETQEPDPTLEAIHTTVPAYRGLAYVVFNRFELQEFGNRPPNFRFVVVNNGTSTVFENIIDYDRDTSGHAYNSTNGMLYATLYNNGASVSAYKTPSLALIDPQSKQTIWRADAWDGSGSGSTTGAIRVQEPFFCGYINTDLVPKVKNNSIVGAIGVKYDAYAFKMLVLWDAETGQVLEAIEWNILSIPDEYIVSAYPDDQILYCGAVKTLGGTWEHFGRIDLNYRGDSWNRQSVRVTLGTGLCAGYSRTTGDNLALVACKQGSRLAGTNAIVAVILQKTSGSIPAVGIFEDGVPAVIYGVSSSEPWYPDWIAVTDIGSSPHVGDYILYDDVSDSFWVHCYDSTSSSQPYWANVDLDGTLIDTYDWGVDYSFTPTTKNNNYFFKGLDTVNGYIWQELNDGKMYQWDIRSPTTPVEYTGSTISSNYTYVPITDSLWGDVSDDVVEYIHNRLDSNTVTLSSIVDDICDRADIDAADYDTTELDSTTVRGYLISRQNSARSALEPLRRGFLFDAADTGSAIEFRHLGQTLDRTLDEDDIGAHSAGQQAPPIITVHREKEVSLPSEMVVKYIDEGANYEVGSQPARRLASKSVQKVALDLPIVFTFDEAAQQADILLHLAHIEREHYECALMPVHSDLIPSDVIAVNDGTNTFRMRIIEKTFQDGFLTVQGVRDDASVLTSAVPGGEITGRATTVGTLGVMRFVILDLPALRDQDNTPGFYIAGYSYTVGWPGGVLFRSTGGEWARLAGVQPVGAIGFCNSTDDAALLNQWDYSATLEIELFTGSLSSDTELNVMNGANIAAWGKNGRFEIIQWVTATDNGDGTYSLSQLLRGRFGTEQYTDDHSVRDYFVVLTEDDIGRIVMQESTIGNTSDYRGVTLGHSVYADTNLDQSFTHEGRALEPWAPVSVEGTRDGSDNLTITWMRQDRVKPRAFWDASLSESTESYEIDIIDGGSPTTNSPYTSTSESYTYTAAQQTADGLTPGDPVDVIIYQISSVVGRGFGTEATL